MTPFEFDVLTCIVVYHAYESSVKEMNNATDTELER